MVTVKQDLAWPYSLMDDLSFVVNNRRTITQLFRYAIVGFASNFAGYIVYLLITSLGFTPKITMTVLYGVGATVGFWGNRNLTFAHKGNLMGTIFRYVMVHCLGYFMNLAILIIWVDKLGYAHQFVQAIAIVVVAAFLFLTFKLFVFTDLNVDNTRKQ
jgi:putative flippase GtrA